MRWPRRRDKSTTQARDALVAAQEEKAVRQAKEAEARWADVRRRAEGLRNLRAENHFGPKLAEAFGKESR